MNRTDIMNSKLVTAWWYVFSELEPDLLSLLLSLLSESTHAPVVDIPHLTLIIYNADIYI